jgi:hypothetical protein
LCTSGASASGLRMVWSILEASSEGVMTHSEMTNDQAPNSGMTKPQAPMTNK